MSLECIYKDIHFCPRDFFTSSDCICDTSLIVPDTKSDIVKILSLKAVSSVSDTKVEKDRLIVSGQVKFTLLYIGEDEQNKICTLCVTTPFSHTVSVTTTENSVPLLDICCQTSSYTLLNSRKVKVSASLKLSGAIYHSKRIKALSSAIPAEIKTRDLTFYSPCSICKKTIPLTDTVELPGNNSEIKAVLKSIAKINDYDYKILNNKAILKGNVLVSVLYLADEDICTSSVTIPFTEVVEAEGLSPNQDAHIALRVADWDTLCDTNLSGEYKMLDISLILSAAITSFNKETITTVTDIYLPKGCIETEKSTVPLGAFSVPVKDEEFVKETFNLNSSQKPFGRILDVDTEVSEISFSDSLITAILTVNVLYLSPESPSVNFHTEKITISHKVTSPEPRNIHLSITNTGYAVTHDTSMDLRMNICFEYDTSPTEDISLYTSCQEKEYTPPHRPSVIVSFVNSGDTLWSIAKKHNIPLSKLASANALEENSILTIGEKLIIPR